MPPFAANNLVCHNPFYWTTSTPTSFYSSQFKPFYNVLFLCESSWNTNDFQWNSKRNLSSSHISAWFALCLHLQMNHSSISHPLDSKYPDLFSFWENKSCSYLKAFLLLLLLSEMTFFPSDCLMSGSFPKFRFHLSCYHLRVNVQP